jgi:hypothetical protein
VIFQQRRFKIKTNFFIIGGSEKAGTTSLFEYFASHPQICSSKYKETDYFRKESCCVADYEGLFNQLQRDHLYYMEASPAYLGLAAKVIPKIQSTTIRPKIVFVVRDPIERLKSSYMFHRSKLYIGEDLDINAYVSLCLDYRSGNISLEDTPFSNSWFLEVLDAGAYQKHLVQFIKHFTDSILVIDFVQLKTAPGAVVKKICSHLNLDDSYFDNFNYFKANETFQSKHHVIHQLGMNINNSLEPFFRKHPSVKQKILRLYKLVNSVRTINGAEFDDSSVQALQDFYKEDVEYLRNYFSQHNQELEWRYFDE